MPAIFRHITDAISDRFRWAGDFDRFAIQPDLARFRRQHAEDHLGGFAAPAADQARQPDDLAGAHAEGDIAGQWRTVEIADIQHNIADFRRLFGEEVFDGAPDHHADQLGFAGVGDSLRADVLAIAQDGDAVGQFKDLV